MLSTINGRILLTKARRNIITIINKNYKTILKIITTNLWQTIRSPIYLLLFVVLKIVLIDNNIDNTNELIVDICLYILLTSVLNNNNIRINELMVFSFYCLQYYILI